ncbi:MAG: AAA family ATPase [Gammaproteobacteria bacterium]|nr:AAA family ATPase [Gammaproteobacteria bacterium]
MRASYFRLAAKQTKELIMKITRIKIIKLFGLLNPDIQIDNNIKIIYGKNGSGKTTILRILNAVLSGSLYELKAIKFQKITCFFDDNSELQISKANDNKTPATRRDQFDKKNLLLSLKKNGKETSAEFVSHNDDVDINVPIHFLEREIPELERVGHKEWRNMETGDFLTFGDVIDVYGSQFPWLSPDYPYAWYKNFIGNFEVKYIQTQRLITYGNTNERVRFAGREPRLGYENTVAKYSIELRNFVRDKLSESAQIGQGLDSTFPNRLLNKETKFDYSDKTIINLANKLDILRGKLERSGLIKPSNVIKIQEESMSDIDQKAIYLYLKDSLKKYEVFEDLERKISLFTAILNKKFDGNKKISFSKDNGIEVFTKQVEKLNPQLLSSGEQHEIILLYDLIFKASKNMLVLIDEPEIPLHIDWQSSFLSDLESINELNNPQFLIATHSPSIIGDRINLAQEIEP